MFLSTILPDFALSGFGRLDLRLLNPTNGRSFEKKKTWPQINADFADQNRVTEKQRLIRKLFNYSSVLIRVIGVNLRPVSLSSETLLCSGDGEGRGGNSGLQVITINRQICKPLALQLCDDVKG
jgi:hypothetical protein